jgi:hypothetical protein
MINSQHRSIANPEVSKPPQRRISMNINDSLLAQTEHATWQKPRWCCTSPVDDRPVPTVEQIRDVAHGYYSSGVGLAHSNASGLGRTNSLRLVLLLRSKAWAFC